MARSLALDLHARPHFLLSGDIHHYERLTDGRTLHVVAGGGGAFLHPAPAPGGAVKPKVCWPNAKQTRALLRQVPFKIALGRSGIIPHLALAALFAPAMALGAYARSSMGLGFVGPVVAVTAVTAVYILIGGARRQYARSVPLALLCAIATAAVPIVTIRLSLWALRHAALDLPLGARAVLMLLLAVLVGSWVFGAYLALLTRFGIEQTQAFTALDHPGYKHFLRLRVRQDGSGVDAWCIGLTDPVAPNEPPVLVDVFRWRPDG
jgi:hypothetical protein